jgi:hypothetical protein
MSPPMAALGPTLASFVCCPAARRWESGQPALSPGAGLPSCGVLGTKTTLVSREGSFRSLKDDDTDDDEDDDDAHFWHFEH